MAFCNIRFKRKLDGTIQVKDKRGEQSLLYSKLVEHVQQNGVPQDFMWYFDKLKEQKKLKSDDPYELALGLYSIAFHSDKSEKYWINRIQDLIPKPILANQGEIDSIVKPIFKKGYTNIQQYLDDIIESKHNLAPLAKSLKRFKKNTSVLLNTDLKIGIDLNYWKGTTTADGIYNTKTKTIIANPRSLKPETVLIHEYIHAVTVDFLYENPDSENVKHLYSLLNYARSYSSQMKNPYPLENIYEFIDGVFTNAEFIKDLKEIPYQGKSFLSELLKWFKDLFKWDTVENTLFSEVFLTSESILNEIYDKEQQNFPDISFEEKVQSEHKKLLNKYGTGFGNEINPHSNWPKLTSDISNANKLFGEKRLTLYQSPDGKWRLRSIQPQTTFVETKVDYAVSNSLEFKVELSDFQKELLDNWDNYFQGYSDLSDSDKLEFIKLAEQGQLEISCKI